MGEDGGQHHRQLAIPTVLELLDLQPGQRLLDIGCGQGVLAPYVARSHAYYVGIDASPKLLSFARHRHGQDGRFVLGNALKLNEVEGIEAGTFEAVVFLLSIQDIEPLEGVLKAAAGMLRAGGRLVILMTHPCFRIPRQSGWGWDDGRKLRFRRVDRYLTSLPVPMQGIKTTTSFHRPLERYINGLAGAGLLVDQIREVPTFQVYEGANAAANNRANQEIPLFLGLRACKAAS
jgi:SAM-dependent methyltransferase